MTFRTLCALAFAVFTLSACVVDPYGRGGGWRDGGGYHNSDHGQRDGGRRVWRE